MIGKLKGITENIGSDQVLIDVQGVGYLVFCSGSSLAALDVGTACQLYILTHVREDHIHLYGFLTLEEKAWFETLTTIQGVGPKVALAILSNLTPADLANALMLEDKRPFQAVSGVGPKVAARLVTELKEKTPKLGLLETRESNVGASARQHVKQQPISGAAAQMRDLISALTNLGYDEPTARGAAQNAIADLGEEAQIGALIPAALKALSP